MLGNKIINIKCQNGITLADAIPEIFFGLADLFTFVESDNPDFILFGPYGNNIPPRGDYIRIGYFCENIIPDLSICDYAFGIPSESEMNAYKYKRIQWHGLDPEKLLKTLSNNDVDRILSTKTKFCNFLYSNPVSYREEFFRQLSKYKKIDAPGRSMNNMSSIDSLFEGNIWERKRKFLSQYKFTIAFENYVYPGYQTEKLYDSIQCDSLPIYCGDPHIDKIFNTKSFVNAPDFLKLNDSPIVSALEKNAQQNFNEYRPQFYKSPYYKVSRKIKFMGRKLKMKMQFNKLDFSNLIDRIIEIDTKDDLYINYLKEPWLKENKVDPALTNRARWIEIFNGNRKI